MTALATVTGVVYRNMGPTATPTPWAGAWVRAIPLVLDETQALVESTEGPPTYADAGGRFSLHLWPGAWRITLPDGEVIDGPDHAGVVVEAGGVYTLEALRGFVPGPGVSVSVMALPTPTAAGQALTLDDDLQPQWQPLGDLAGAVESVNGETGAVVLDAADVGADPAGTAAAAVAAHAAATDPHPAYTTADEAAAAAPVQSVAGRTGDVTLSSLDVTDWAEAVQDAVAAMLVSGANVTLAYDDAAGKVTVTAAGGDAEVMRDTIGAALVGINGVTVTINDALDTITLAVAGLTIAQVTGLQGALDDKAPASHTHTPAQIGTGTPAAGTYVDGGTGAWTALPAGGGGLVASFAVSGQREAVCSSFDAATDTFTSPAHGYVSGTAVCAFSNSHEQIAIRQFLPGGMMTGGRWFVVNATADTFQLSLTAGGAPIDLTVRETENLAQWHFEAVASSVTAITGLAPSHTYRLVAIGQVQGYANTYWHSLSVNGSFVAKTTALLNGLGSESYHEYLSADYRFDTRGSGMVRGGFVNAFQRTASADNAVTTRTFSETLQIGVAVRNVPITSLGFQANTISAYWANGSVMEVWA